MYAQEPFADTPPTVEALRFTVQQYSRMRGLTRVEKYPAPQQQQQAVLAGQQNQIPAAAPQALNVPQPLQQPAALQTATAACFNCGDPS